jgi:dTDP-glucose 4,6-dehydratase
MKTILVTGTLGFIFSNFIRYAVDSFPQYRFVGVDKAVQPYNLYAMFEHPDYKFYFGDIADQHLMNNIFKTEKPDIVINGAAESFVDDSIKDIKPFLHSNVLGAQCLVNSSLQFGVERFVQISTDEIYGQLQPGDPAWEETSPGRPRNPYSASKYSAEIIIYAANQTHGLQYNITRSCNNFGPCQPPRNLVPRTITSIIKNVPIPIHGQGKQMREWIYVLDHCSAIMKIVESAPLNETYNIGSGTEYSNLNMVKKIGSMLNVSEPAVTFITDRKGHDFRYKVDCSKIKSLGWKPIFSFDEGMEKSLEWYLENREYYV